MVEQKNGIRTFREEFDSIFQEKTVNFELLPVLIVLITAILIAPTYPTEKISYCWSVFEEGGTKVTNFDLQPPLVIILNGFEWQDGYLFFGSVDSGIASSHKAPYWPLIVYAMVILSVCCAFIRFKRNGRQILVEETNAQIWLTVFGFALLTLGLVLSIGLLFAGIFGIPLRLVPVNGEFDLWLLFLVVAPAFISVSLLLLSKAKKLQRSSARIDNIPLTQSGFPMFFSICIALFVVGSFTLQTIVPQTEPLVVRNIDIISINEIISDSDNVQIQFGTPYPGNYAGNLEIRLVSNHHTVSIYWPDTVSGSNITMPCTENDITVFYHSQSMLDSPLISNGDILIINNLYKNESYFITIYNYARERSISTVGPNTFTTGGDNYE